jgi:hypothetical protein
MIRVLIISFLALLLQNSETNLKIQLIYKITYLIDFEKNDEEKFYIGFIGEDEITQNFNYFNSKMIENKDIEVLPFDIQNSSKFQLIYVAENSLDNYLEIVKNKPEIDKKSIVISASSDYAKLGTMINLTTKNEKLQIEINLKKLKSNKNKISHQLIKRGVLID